MSKDVHVLWITFVQSIPNRMGSRQYTTTMTCALSVPPHYANTKWCRQVFRQPKESWCTIIPMLLLLKLFQQNELETDEIPSSCNLIDGKRFLPISGLTGWLVIAASHRAAVTKSLSHISIYTFKCTHASINITYICLNW